MLFSSPLVINIFSKVILKSQSRAQGPDLENKVFPHRLFDE